MYCMKCKILWETKSVSGNNYIGTKIILLGDKKFKIMYSSSNGSSDLSVDIMTSDGSFDHILSKHSLGFEHMVKYVSDVTSKDADFKRGFELCEKVLTKIYS